MRILKFTLLVFLAGTAAATVWSPIASAQRISHRPSFGLFQGRYLKALLSLLTLLLNTSVSYGQQLEDSDQFRKAGVTVGQDASSLTLVRTYPNATDPTISVSLSLDREQAVEIALFDVLGRHLQQVHNGLLKAGTHQFRIDVSGIPSGHYFLHAVGEPIVATKHIILRK